MSRASSELWRLAAALGGVAALTVVFVRWLHVANAATVSTTFLMVVLVVAATSRLWVAVATSVVAMLSFNFFFLPPLGTLRRSPTRRTGSPSFSFLAVSLVASNLSAVARARTAEALGRRDELARLFDLSRDVLVHHRQSREALTTLARRWRGASTSNTWRSPCRGATSGTSSTPAPSRVALDRRAARRGVRRRADHARVRCLRAHLRRPPRTGGRRPDRAARAAARRAPGRSACWRRRAGRWTPAPSTPSPASWPSPSSARSLLRGAQGRRADAPERRAEVGPARLDRPRPADAAHGHPRGGGQPAGAAPSGRRP